jgi:hypothetical protein
MLGVAHRWGKWNEWKFDYLGRHLEKELHVDSATGLQNSSKMEFYDLLPIQQEIEVWRENSQSAKKASVSVLTLPNG